MSVWSKMYRSGLDFITNPNRVFGSPGIKRRLGLAAGYLGAGYAIDGLVSNQQANSRAYYGEEHYNKYYQGSESIGSLAKGVGYFLGGMSLIDRDYISRGRNTYKYLFSKEARRSRSLLNRKTVINRTGLTEGGYGPTINYKQRFNKSDHPVVVSRRNRAKATLKTLGERPGIGPVQIFSLAAMSGVITSGPMGELIQKSPSAMTNIGIGLGVTAGAGVAKSLWKNRAFGATAATVLGGYAGSTVVNRYNNPSAEGNITELNLYDDSVVSRMNFSTAGLVQALHNANRRM